jgi:hypothetical protein
MSFLERKRIHALVSLVLTLGVLPVQTTNVGLSQSSSSMAQITTDSAAETVCGTNTTTTTLVITESTTVTNSTVFVTTTSVSTSTIYVPTLVGVTVTTTLSTFTTTVELWHTTTESRTYTATTTTTETAPFWSTVTLDPGGVCVLVIGVLLGMVAVALHRRYPWAGPLGITAVYVTPSLAAFQLRQNRIQYLLGYLFVILGAIIEGLTKKKKEEK